MDHTAFFASTRESLALSASIPLESDGTGSVRADFTLAAGQSARFFLEYLPDGETVTMPLSDARYYDLLDQTLAYWRTWLSQCHYAGRWREMVHRSAPTGALVAAPTTSLPRVVGSTSNWDYRYTWLRDASFTIDTLQPWGSPRNLRCLWDGWTAAAMSKSHLGRFLRSTALLEMMT